MGGVAVSPDEALYGTAYVGGAKHDGCVFRLTPPAVSGDQWTYTVLASFDGANGMQPATMLLALDGALYGAAQFGGAYGFGTVFQVTF